MKTPEWTKPALYGAAVGALALAIIGFGFGGWLTASKAERLAADHARAQVVAALVPICVEQSRADPEQAGRLAEMKAATNYGRSEVVMRSGWATIPGTTAANRQVATACTEMLIAS